MPDEEPKKEGLNEQEPVSYDVPTTPEETKTDDFVSQEPETPPATPALAITKPPAKKSKKKLLIIIAAVLVLLGGGAAAYWYLEMRDNPAPASATTNEQAAPQTEEVKTGLNTIAYGFKESDSKPYELLWRPAESGDKTSAKVLSDTSVITHSDVYKNKVAVVVEPGSESDQRTEIWYSEDGGKSYKSIYTADYDAVNGMNAQVTSLQFSTDGSSVVFGLLPPGTTNKVMEVVLSSGEAKELFTSEKAGVFVYGYQSEKKQIIYAEGCYNCGGNSFSPILMNDLSTNTKTEIAAETAENGIQFAGVNKDFSKVLIKYSTVNKAAQDESLEGASLYPPYELAEITLSDKAKVSLGTFGEEVTDPSAAFEFSQGGYMMDGTTPYFALGNQIFMISGGNNTLMFESTKQIKAVYLVSSENVITSSGDQDTADFVLNNYFVKDKKNSVILNGDGGTTIFGVTEY